ncbi:PIF1-like helicase-domain-containing protein [Suillus clintonianus]|uniref:PIF1-like helicase-domain-containing protein n=1 Tax=Suillus clintonianus TaxID=1904413 RepID=UPI001B876F06|nr:PIF1-like helicase-domain-containing protein [Suillus clintonianus]KAG2139345.1 PIF1-like helicase-domain-containing protein [Suillus clintonianus]
MPIHSGEPFYLRALLLHQPATSFIDLCTIEGHVFDTFHDAACDLGLFDNENKGYLALQEAVKSLRTPSQLQFLFSQIILEGALSATAYDHGLTAHHMFSIPVTDDNVNLHSSIHPHSPHADLIQNAMAIIWDELPAINKAVWESIDKLCHLVCNQPGILFGGLTFIGLGDFHQASPIVSGAGETATLVASVKSSTLWPSMCTFSLNTAICSMGDPQFTAFIDRIGEDCSGNQENLRLMAATTDFNNTIDFLFPPHILTDAETCLDYAFLSPLNVYLSAPAPVFTLLSALAPALTPTPAPVVAFAISLPSSSTSIPQNSRF